MPQICYQFAEKGTCRFGDDCKFDHVVGSQVRGSGKQSRKSRSRKKDADSSIDHIVRFFEGYPTFEYDPTASFMPQFYAMCDQFDWDRDHPDREEARFRLQDAMVKQFNNMYGTSVGDLKAWQALCRVLEIDPVPDKLKKCQKLVMATHVNICDLVEAPTLGRPTIFDTEQELASYSKDTRRIFPRSNVHAGSLLRFLLRHIFSPPSRDA